MMKIKVAYYINLSAMYNPDTTPDLTIHRENVWEAAQVDWLEKTLKRTSVVDAGWIEVDVLDPLGQSIKMHEATLESYHKGIKATQETIQSLLCLPHLEEEE